MHFLGIRRRGTDSVIFHRCLNGIFHFIDRHSGSHAGTGLSILDCHTACHLDILIIGKIIDHCLSTVYRIACHRSLNRAVYVVGRTGGSQIDRNIISPFACFHAKRQPCCYLCPIVMGVVQDICRNIVVRNSSMFHR